MNILKLTDLSAENEWILWCVNYISIKVVFKDFLFTLCVCLRMLIRGCAHA